MPSHYFFIVVILFFDNLSYPRIVMPCTAFPGIYSVYSKLQNLSIIHSYDCTVRILVFSSIFIILVSQFSDLLIFDTRH